MNDLNDLFRQLSEAKAQDPKYQKVKKLEEQVKESVKADLGSLFSELSALKVKRNEIIEQNPELVKEEFIQEVAPIETPIGEIPPEQQSPAVADLPELDKWLRTPKVSEPTNSENDFAVINKKIKFLEQWIGKIDNAGPGSGEVNFRYLDDVNRITMTPSNDNWVLEYDATTKKVQFTENIGPVKTIKLNTAGPDIETVPGMLAWNVAEDCMNIYQNDGSVLQSGLETYIRVHNDTGAPLLNGSVVRFSGVDPGVLGVPTASLMTGDELQDPLFIIGVVTSDIAIQGTGRATTLGNVRNLNTTGSDVGETWVVGDILWVHPTILGKMTKVKPTAPDLTISVAAVMVVDDTDGVILVRPTFAPRLSYGTFLNTGNHTVATENTPTTIPLDTEVKARGFTLTGSADSRVTCSISGLYNFAVSYQITSSNSAAKDIYFWLRRDGVDIPLTSRRQTIVGNGVYATFACTWSVSLTAGQYVQLMWATTDTTVILEPSDATAFSPTSPSVLLTITEAAL